MRSLTVTLKGSSYQVIRQLPWEVSAIGLRRQMSSRQANVNRKSISACLESSWAKMPPRCYRNPKIRNPTVRQTRCDTSAPSARPTSRRVIVWTVEISTFSVRTAMSINKMESPMPLAITRWIKHSIRTGASKSTNTRTVKWNSSWNRPYRMSLLWKMNFAWLQRSPNLAWPSMKYRRPSA